MSTLLEKLNTTRKNYKLSTIIELIGGGTPKTTNPDYWNGDIPWLSVVDFNNDLRWVSDTQKKITKSGVENSATRILDKGDIIVSARGTVGALAQLSKPMAFNQSCYGIRPIEKLVDKSYLYYLLKARMFSLQKAATGGVFDTIIKESFDYVDVEIPDLPIQKKIAEILGAYDAKIENNNLIIKNLEATAQAIFNEWFVNFRFPGYKKVKMVDSELGLIPENWKVKPLGSVVDIEWGDTSVTKSSYIANGYPAFSASGRDGFRENYDFDRTGIVLSAIGANCGATWLVYGKWSVIKNTIRFWSVNDSLSTEYLYLATIKPGLWPQRGSAQPFITLGEARKMSILVPAKQVVEVFNNFVVEAFSRIDKMRLENEKLRASRDQLLKKLI